MFQFAGRAARGIGQNVSAVVTLLLLTGCGTSGYLPEVCKAPEDVSRDAKCSAAVDNLPPAEAAKIRELAAMASAPSGAAPGGLRSDSHSDY